jgi:hypothetical protein
MEEYENIQIARRVTRLIRDAGKPTFPLVTMMYIFLLLATAIIGIKELISAII